MAERRFLSKALAADLSHESRESSVLFNETPHDSQAPDPQQEFSEEVSGELLNGRDLGEDGSTLKWS